MIDCPHCGVELDLDKLVELDDDQDDDDQDDDQEDD